MSHIDDSAILTFFLVEKQSSSFEKEATIRYVWRRSVKALHKNRWRCNSSLSHCKNFQHSCIDAVRLYRFNKMVARGISLVVKRMLCKHLSPVRLWYSPFPSGKPQIRKSLFDSGPGKLGMPDCAGK